MSGSGSRCQQTRGFSAKMKSREDGMNMDGMESLGLLVCFGGSEDGEWMVDR